MLGNVWEGRDGKGKYLSSWFAGEGIFYFSADAGSFGHIVQNFKSNILIGIGYCIIALQLNNYINILYKYFTLNEAVSKLIRGCL